MINRLKYLFSNKKIFDLLISSILCILIIFSRVPFISKFLYDWDSVNYALSFGYYDIFHSQPHPPGYILYVALGRIINTIFNDPNNSMIFISIIFSMLTVILIYFLAKQMFSKKIAIISTILLIFNPIFWFYGEIASIYPAEALFATLIAYTSYQVIRGEEKFIYVSAIILGLSGGFRQDLIIFMLPLWLFTLFYIKIGYKRIIKVMFVLIFSILLWYIPTIILAGGYSNYTLLTTSQLMVFLKSHSIIFKADISNQIKMDNLLISWSILGTGILGIVITILFCINHFKSIVKSGIFRNPKIIFFILWIMPSFLFYLLILIVKPGYILVFLPSFGIIMGYVFVKFSSDITKKFKGISLYHCLIPLVILYVSFSTVQFLYTDNEISYIEIKIEDQVFNGTIQTIGYDKYKPENTIIFMDDENLYRKLMFSLPEYDSYCYSYPLHTLWHGKPDSPTPTLATVTLNSSTENIIWILDNDFLSFSDLNSKIELKLLKSMGKMNIYYSNVKNQEINFEINGIKFKTVN